MAKLASFGIVHAGQETESLAALLRANHLPTDDLGDPRQLFFRRCAPGGSVLGYIGLELHGRVALLRSLVTTESARGRGHGSALVAHALRHATAAGVEDLYLLTTTAADFFAAHGFERVDRSAVPEAIAETREFTGLCPASAIVMRRRILGISQTDGTESG